MTGPDVIRVGVGFAKRSCAVKVLERTRFNSGREGAGQRTAMLPKRCHKKEPQAEYTLGALELLPQNLGFFSRAAGCRGMGGAARLAYLRKIGVRAKDAMRITR
jgi:hypothetical protein